MRARLLCAAALLAAPLQAQDFGGECYARVYGGAHLAKSPNQTVAALSIRFVPMPGESGGYSGMAVLSATMSEAAANRANGVAGKTLRQVTLCEPLDRDWTGANSDWIKTGRMTCYAECDGGMFQITDLTAEKLVIRTNGVALDDLGGCEAAALLADAESGGGPFETVTTSYRLTPASSTACATLN